MALAHDLGRRPFLQPLDVVLKSGTRLFAQITRVVGKEHVAKRLLAIELLERLRAEHLFLARRRRSRRRRRRRRWWWRRIRRGRWRRRRRGGGGWLGFGIAVTSSS